MYGFVNQAIRDLVVENYGQKMWERVRSDARVNQTHFVSDEIYDDRFTYEMVGAIATELQLTLSQTLEAFGEYWVSFVDARGFGSLLSANGATLEEFLSNLDLFHSRLAMAYPKFLPPEFEYEKLAEGKFQLTYLSTRKGLAPMVKGIIAALARRYETAVEIEMEPLDAGAKFMINTVAAPEFQA